MSLPLSTHWKKNITLAVPVMLSQLGHIMVGVADSMMVGRLGTVPLAATALSIAIFTLLLTFGIGVSMAITPLTAHAVGQKNQGRMREILKSGFLVVMGTGLCLFVLMMFGASLFPYLDQEEAVVEAAIPYFRLLAISFLPLMLFQVIKQFVEGLSFTRQAMMISISANVVNIGLNYLLIFGKGGFPAYGLNGAGYATVISRVLMVVAMLVYFLKSPAFASIRQGLDWKKFQPRISYKLGHIGVPIGLQFVFESGAFAFASIMVGWISSEALAAHQIALNLASISFMAVSGIGAAATIRVGNQLGARQYKDMRMAGFSNIQLGMAWMAICGLLLIVFREQLPSLYIDDPEVIGIASGLLVVAAFFQISDGTQVVAIGSLRGMADVKIPTLITLFSYWMIGLPVGYFLSSRLGLGAEGVWYGLLTGLSMAALLLSYRFHRSSARKVAQKNPAPRPGKVA